MSQKQYKKKVVVCGGAFNPPHLGHAATIENIIRLFPCDEIWIMPSADRHDKTISVTGEDRLNMVNIMISEVFPDSQVPIVVSDMEIKRKGLTTTFETKQELEKNYPDYQFYFQLGTDIVGDIKEKWFNGAELFNSANFLVVRRPGANLPKDLPKNAVLLLDKQVSQMDLSSTFVRRLLARGYSGLPYISKGVAEYIKERKLYR